MREEILRCDSCKKMLSSSDERVPNFVIVRGLGLAIAPEKIRSPYRYEWATENKDGYESENVVMFCSVSCLTELVEKKLAGIKLNLLAQ